MQRTKPKSNNYFSRILITLIGVAFIAWGLTTLALGFVGTKATALITDIRREGGERNEVKRGRYTYNISYTFILPGGKTVNGVTKYIGDAVYLKADGKSKVPVRYFSFFPALNALASDTKPGVGQLIFIAIGIFLIYIVNKRPKKVNRRI
ncbi:MAG: hypothetical protein Q7U54_22035 [Bacteroidales bacterium]|nr:hypothetical protein [Bacteroidales bacterium]